MNRFLGFLYVYKYGLWILRRLLIRPQVLNGLKVQRAVKKTDLRSLDIFNNKKSAVGRRKSQKSLKELPHSKLVA
jgi:hypothetical protein